MRAAVTHRHAKSLGRPQDHISPLLTWRGQHQQTEQVGGHTGQGMLLMQLLDHRTQVANLTMGIGVLQQSTEHLVVGQVIHSIDNQLEAKAFGAGLQHRKRLWMAVLIGKEHIAFRLRHALGQGHGFGRRRGFIEQ
ncbi:hypothetical protein D3C78_1120700 [compost metagenome]